MGFSKILGTSWLVFRNYRIIIRKVFMSRLEVIRPELHWIEHSGRKGVVNTTYSAGNLPGSPNERRMDTLPQSARHIELCVLWYYVCITSCACVFLPATLHPL